ncbi:MAG TPA: flavin reductase family protein [Candidatus Brocadiia bacterium]|nr:flavin reductase family protein [Candidatus Brocadiia bacterium]
MPKKTVSPICRPVYPTPAALITSCDEDGRPNIITLGETFNVSIETPVIIGIAVRQGRYSYEIITRTREFVVNLPDESIVRQVDLCGTVSGRKADKFKETGLTPLPASVVKAPLIAECPVNVECKLLSVATVGDHDLLLGEAVAMHADEDVLNAEGRVDPAKLKPVIFMTWEYYGIGKYLETAGYSRRDKRARKA